MSNVFFMQPDFVQNLGAEGSHPWCFIFITSKYFTLSIMHTKPLIRRLGLKLVKY